MAKYTIDMPDSEITIETDENGGSVSIPRFDGVNAHPEDILVDLEETGTTSIQDVESALYHAAIDTLESFLLALACAGYDMNDSKMKEAIQTTIDSIDNNLFD